MKFLLTFLPLFLFGVQHTFCQQEKPEITEISVEDIGNDQAQISFNFTDSDSDSCDVQLYMSLDEGVSYELVVDVDGNEKHTLPSNVEGQITVNQPTDHQGDIMYKLSIQDDAELDIHDLVSQVDSSRLKQDLESIVGVRHISNHMFYNNVRDVISDRLASYNLVEANEEFQYQTDLALNITSLQVGHVYNHKEYLVGGHYDSVEESPGADDNATAVVAMLEAARLLSQYEFVNTIRFVSFDLEEYGLIGAQDFLTKKSKYGDIQAYLNMEMIGYYSEKPNSQKLPTGFEFVFPDLYDQLKDNEFRGDFILNVGNSAGSLEMMNDYAQITETYVPELKVLSVASPGNGSQVPDLRRSDHAPFWTKGIPALMLTDAANFRNPNYHLETDVIDSLDMNFLTNNTKAAIAYIAEKAEYFHGDTEEVTLNTVSNDEFQIITLNVYPNPAEIYFTIDMPQVTGEKAISIFNAEGKCVEKRVETGFQVTLDTTKLTPGVYQIEVLCEDGTKGQGKLVVL